MNDAILELSDRGQITIPKTMRDQVVVKRFVCYVQNNRIILEPLQTRDEFLSEIDAAEKDWKANGGLGLKDIKKKYKL